MRLKTSVEEIDAGRQQVVVSDGQRLDFDQLMLATGARARSLNVPGEDLPGVFYLRDLSDALKIKSYVIEKACRRALVVGAGFVGLELSEAFRQLEMYTALMHRGALPMHRLGDDFGGKIVEALTAGGMVFLPETVPVGFESGKNDTLHVTTAHGTFDADIVVIGIGVQPEVELARKAGVDLGSTGAVAVNERMQTSVENIFAAGDCCQCHHLVTKKPTYQPLGDVANKQGRVAGTNIGGGEAIFPGVVGASCLKVFDLEVATTGINEAEAVAAGFAPKAVTIAGRSRAHSYPGSKPLWLRLIADSASGKLIGAQCVGAEGAVNRINALSLAVTAGMTVDQLAMVDFAYAPPFSGSWDPIHIGAQKLMKA